MITAIMMYVLLKRWNEHYAFVVSILCLFSPFILGDSTFGIEDEVIVVFITMLGILLYKVRAERLGAAMVAVGFWTKFIPVITFPYLWLRTETKREKLISIGLFAAVSLMVAIPFLIICPIEFITFPIYYTMGQDGGYSASLSVINLLGIGGVPISGLIGQLATVGALFLSYSYCYIKKLDVWRGSLVIFTVFLCVYPEAHLKYYAIPYLLLTVWAAKDLKLLFRMLPVYVILLVAQGYAVAPPGLNPSYSWVIAIVLLIIGDILLLDTVRRVIKTSSFIDGEPEKKDAGTSD